MIPFFPMADKTENRYELNRAEFQGVGHDTFNFHFDVALPKFLTFEERHERTKELGAIFESNKATVTKASVGIETLAFNGYTSEGRAALTVLLAQLDLLLATWNGS